MGSDSDRFDNDGWIDLAVLVETDKGTELRVLRNRGAAGFEDVSSAVGADKIKLKNPRSVIAADVDGDGAADLIVTQADGPPVVLHNVGGKQESFAAHRFDGAGGQQDRDWHEG